MVDMEETRTATNEVVLVAVELLETPMVEEEVDTLVVVQLVDGLGMVVEEDHIIVDQTNITMKGIDQQTDMSVLSS